MRMARQPEQPAEVGKQAIRVDLLLDRVLQFPNVARPRGLGSLLSIFKWLGIL
jgi:hypothetical protein